MPEQDLIFRVRADAQSAMAELRKVGAEFLSVRDKLQATGGEMQRTVAALDIMRNGTEKAQASAAVLTTWLDKQGSSFDRLRGAVDPAFASLMRYDTAVREVQIAEQMGIRSKQETASVLTLLKSRYDAEALAASGAGAAAVSMGDGHRRAGYMVQNAAFQVGDFAVQVAAGTSMTRAFGQQVPQLLGAFGVWGAVIGAAAAILIPLAGNLFGAGKAANNTQDNMSALTGALSSYDGFAKTATSSTAALQGQFGRFAEEMRADAQWLAQVDVGKASAAFDKVAKDMYSDFRAFNDLQIEFVNRQDRYNKLIADGASPENPQIALMKSQLDAMGEAASKVAGKMHLTTDQVLTLDQALSSMAGAKTMAEIESQSQSALDAIRAMFPAGEAVPEAVQGIVDKLADVHAQAVVGVATMEQMPGALNSAAGAASVLAGQMGNVGMAANAALSRMIALSAQNKLTQDQAQALARMGGSLGVKGPAGMGDTSTSTHEGRLAADALRASWTSFTVTPSSTGSGGSGGTPAVDPVQAAIDAAAKALADFHTSQLAANAAFTKSLADDFATPFASFVAGTMSGKDAFSSFTQSIIADIAKIATQKFTDSIITPMIGSLMGGLGFNAPVASAKGNVFGGGNVIPFANGGVPGLSTYRNAVVSGPTFFAMGGTGVMGEAGPEAIMPLARGPGGVLGVRGGGGGQVVNIINQTGQKAEVTRRQQGGASVIDVLIKAVKGAVADDILRGGQVSDAMSSAFGSKRQGAF